jgi:starch phosphorylase
MDQISSGAFSGGDRERFKVLVDSILEGDEYMVLADFRSYVECQARVSAAYRDRRQWTEMSIVNASRTGKFSSDRSIQEYCDKIWHVRPVEGHPEKG